MYKVFFMERTNDVFCYLRRFSNNEERCIDGNSYHNAMTFLERRNKVGDRIVISDSHPHDDVKWPRICKCGYEFKESDEWQLFTKRVYRDITTGNEYTEEDAPVGACYDALWRSRKGPDGRALVVKTPEGWWHIDGRANNCTMPDENSHRCWIRSGSVEEGTLHVDKNGFTCAAGAGSIIIGSYHGFCRNGYLVSC